ncbi:ATP-binding protein [Argonema galeatum]|uniref:ATP-binding protein n=1 Tax=Argonema galeatum TaxID=2942762 RepID=UPI002011D6BB|nr:ATP-binding protein [Argonema galeatum]MCL1464562.1 response regulator [Argonema galeatum A003/A1]
MDLSPEPVKATLVDEIFPDGGEMGQLMRSRDWSATPLGPADNWPQSLRTSVSICLASRFPILIWWGPELIKIYNDAYRPILGATKHPQALGQPGRDCWPEIWDIIGPMLEGVREEGKATWSDDSMLPLDRNGFVEECYFTFSYSPIRDETGAVGGVFTAVTETTRRVLGERRLQTLRDLAANTTEAKTVEEACALAANTLVNNTADIPFALLYLLDANSSGATLAATTGCKDSFCESLGFTADEEDKPIAKLLAQVAQTNQAQLLHISDLKLPIEPGKLQSQISNLKSQIQSVLILPVARAGKDRPAGILVAGISPFLSLDEDYRGFFELVAGQVASAVANASAYEEERQRSEALAELYRAKTAFFSNVSHEFRTPLTLLLSPVEDALADTENLLPTMQRDRVEIVHRNSLRLLKLVNTLLDFSRIEAGREEAVCEPIDLAAFTAELASVWRSTIEKAGLRLIVKCPTLSEPVYADREMWEKIVFNLISNAFKFTFAGEISVTLRACASSVELEVGDTGTGIPPEELPHLFERFHRVRGAASRTHEGTGIGLALVQELVRLHGGTVQVASIVGEGTTFTVSIPTWLSSKTVGDEEGRGDRGSGGAGERGSGEEKEDSLCQPTTLDRTLRSGRRGAEGQSKIQNPKSKISYPLGAAPYIEEASRWLVEEAIEQTGFKTQNSKNPRILLADDNADMRDYVKRLLEQSYEVETVADGAAALVAAIDRIPDLVLTDVMMPGLDGFELLRQLRADPRTREVPIILLSARAGEESRVEGLEAGADDYLIKPFSARELVARVDANLKMARIRREAAVRERAARIEAEAAQEKVSHILESIGDGFVAFDREWRYTYLNKKATELIRKSQEELLGKSIWEVFPDAIGSKYYTELHRARAEQIPVHFEYYYPPLDSWFENDAYPTADGISVFGRDISDRKRAQAEREQMIKLLESEQALLEAVLQQMPAAAIVAEAPSGKLLLGNKLVEKIWRQPFLEADTIEQYRIYQGFHLDGQPYEAEEWPLARSIRNGEVVTEEEINFQRGDGSYGTMRVSSTPIYNYEGSIVAGVMTFYDITSSKRAKEELRASEEKFRTLVNSMQDIVFTLDREQRFTGVFGSWLERTNFQAEFFLGKTPQEIYDLPSSDLRLPQSEISNLKLPAAIHEASHKKALSGETVVYEWLFQSVNGTEYCQTSLSPLRDANGDIIGVVGVGRDITQLHRGKEVQRFLAEASKVLTATLDYETTLKSVARLAVPYLADYCVIFVLEEEDRIRRVAVAHRDAAKEALLKELQAYPLDLNSQAPVAQVLRKRQPLLVQEVSDSILEAISCEVNQDRILRELDPKSLVIVPLVARGQMLGAIGFTYAESGRRYQQSDLALAEDLAYRAALAFSLAQLYRKSQEANRIKDEFLAIVSHELRTPLNAILGWATLLRTRKFDEARTASALETIERNARSQSQLIEDLLDVSRMLRDKLSLNLRTLDLVTVIEAATEAVRPTAQNNNIELKLILCDRGCLVSADFNRLQQVVWNLLSNAIKFTPSGGQVEIRLSINFGLEDTALQSNIVASKEQPTNPKSPYAQITVSDTGKGISPNFLPYVFDRFRQADSTTTREQGGLGLGLAIVRHLVDLHGGTVCAASDGEGKGATFTVKLPLLQGIEDRRLSIENFPVPSPQSPVPSPLSGLQVLVVDDEADTRDFLTTALEEYGAKVMAADSTESALEALQEWKANVLVSDIGMPGEDGYALIRKLRALESERGGSLPAVALTAYAMEKDRIEALDAGFQRHLSKPIDPIELVSAIEQLVKTKS